MAFLANLNKYWLVYATAVSYKVGGTYRAQFIILNCKILYKKSIFTVARFTNIVVWGDFLHCSFGCFSRRQGKLIMKEPLLCMSNLSHGPIAT